MENVKASAQLKNDFYSRNDLSLIDDRHFYMLSVSRCLKLVS